MTEMSRRALRLAAAAGVSLCVAATLSETNGGLVTAAEWERDFKSPPLALKSLPLWHLNGALTQEGIAAQLQASRDASGFAGVAVLPVKETQPEYLSEAYFERYGDILETCKRLGMKVVFYDDIGFPSGSAGGLMRKRFPDDTACRLDNTETNIAGPAEWERALPLGTLMGAVAMNTQSKERRDISASARDGRIAWTVPAGQWTLMLFTCVRAGGHVDYLCPESVDKFFSLTYDAYYKRFAPHFGTTIGMTFFDDVGVRGAERRTWTPAFNEKFEKKYGVSPVAFYPALWHDIGPDTEAARVALFGFRAELLAEGYPRKVHEWAAAHGLQSSGHAMGQYHPQPAFLGGDHILFYRHSDIPMIDSIHYYGHGRPGFKLTSSAACSYERPLTAVEIYGNYKTFDAAMLYRSGMELFARGANVLLPHGMWYDPQKVRIKPLISHLSPEIGPGLSAYNDWVGRSSLLLQGGRHVADIAVLYPVAAMQAFARLDAVVDQPKTAGNTHPGLFVPPDTDLNALSDRLTGELRRDFTFLHPEILNDRCTVNGSVLHLSNATNYEDYRVLIMPGERVIRWSSLQRIKQFCEAGGKVIATTQLPCKSAEFGHDRDVAETVRELFGERGTGAYSKRANAAGGVAYFVPNVSGTGLAAALDDALPVADVAFLQAGPAVAADKGMLSYLHKVKDGRNIYYLANSTDARVETFITVRGRRTLQRWNPHDGSIAAAETSAVVVNHESCTRVRLQLEPVRSEFFVETPPASDRPWVNQSVTADQAVVTNRETRSIAGWSVHIHAACLATNAFATARALELLKEQLEEVVRTVPPPAVAELRKVPLWLSPEYPGTAPKAEYHPNVNWLRQHGRDPAMAKGVEFTNIRIFDAETRRMPNFALHELAHAYQDRVLGSRSAEIKAAYERAKAGGSYDKVKRRDAEGREHLGRAYALTNPQEYFAETTEAYFSRNDFFPFTRDELKQHDPAIFALLARLWSQP